MCPGIGSVSLSAAMFGPVRLRRPRFSIIFSNVITSRQSGKEFPVGTRNLFALSPSNKWIGAQGQESRSRSSCPSCHFIHRDPIITSGLADIAFFVAPNRSTIHLTLSSSALCCTRRYVLPCALSTCIGSVHLVRRPGRLMREEVMLSDDTVSRVRSKLWKKKGKEGAR